MIRFSVAAATLLSFALSIGCTNHKKQTLLGNICDTTDTRFSTVVNPIIISECLSCHSNSNATNEGGGVSLEGYANVNANYQDILSDINSGNMPKGQSKLEDCAILKIQTWVNRGAKND
jgi:uncharacterized membrane protein